MMFPIIDDFLMYLFLAWGTNMSLNLLYVLKKYVPKTASFDYPIDGGLQYKGNRLVGESTTVWGLILCLAISFVVYFYFSSFKWLIIPLLVYCGHMLGSIIKRRMHKKGGEYVPFVDHGDYMILTGLVFMALGYVTPTFALASILITYLLHPIVCFLAFRLKLREHPY